MAYADYHHNHAILSHCLSFVTVIVLLYTCNKSYENNDLMTDVANMSSYLQQYNHSILMILSCSQYYKKSLQYYYGT